MNESNAGTPGFGNLFAGVERDASSKEEEIFETLIEKPGWRLERIVSQGQATPDGTWYDQERDEWVVLLQGRAGLRFEHETEPRVLEPGDHVLIPAHCRHRVDWTDPGAATVWLALHFEGKEL